MRTEIGAVKDGIGRIEARLDRAGGFFNGRRVDEWARRIEKLEGNKPGAKPLVTSP